jgi:hypothetical protein
MINKPKIICFIALLPLILFSGTFAACTNNQAAAAGIQSTDPINYDAQIYAELNGVTIDEALHRFELQDAAGELDAALTANEADTFAGLWLEHQPEFKVVVAFTKDGEATIQKYLTEELADVVEVRTVDKTTTELEKIQMDFINTLRSLNILADSYTYIPETKVIFSIKKSDKELFDSYVNNGDIIVPDKVYIEFVDELAHFDADAAQPDSLQDWQPLEIVSVEGPLDPINPGGPVVGITIKNISEENIVSLNATLDLNMEFSFEFEVSDENPLLPGDTIYVERILINGGFADDILYPLEISGEFQDGPAFSYAEQVVIKKPASATS